MARPRTVPAEESLRHRPGDPPPTGTHVQRRAKAAIREQERQHKLLAEQVGDEELASLMRPDREVLAALRKVAKGKFKGKDARNVIAAARLMVEFSVAKPAADVNVRAATILVVKDPFADDLDMAQPAVEVPCTPMLTAAAVAALPDPNPVLDPYEVSE